MKRFWISLVLMFSLAAAQGNNGGVLGAWTGPTGSTILIHQCGAKVCVKLIAISSAAASKLDTENPNARLRTRPLCGLEIGKDFHLTNPDTAVGGQLYDPQTGKTFSGTITRDKEKLKLRSHVGLELFGRTEIWTRARSDVAPCHA